MALKTVGELGGFIRDQRRNARLSLRKLSNMAGVSNPYLSQIERGLRRPSAEILQSIAKALRISAETLYIQAGILEERSDEVDVPSAILRDATLNEKQRQVLIEIYQSFRHENELEAKGRTPKKATAAKPSAKSGSASKPAKKPAAKKAKTSQKTSSQAVTSQVPASSEPDATEATA